MSSKYGFDKSNISSMPGVGLQQSTRLSRIDPIITDILNEVIATYGDPHQTSIQQESLEGTDIFAIWTVPNISLLHPDDKKPLIVTFKEITKRGFFSTKRTLRLEVLWGMNQRITEEHHPPLFSIAEALRDHTDLVDIEHSAVANTSTDT